jgi:cytochrome oxidase assembly protein ShyY1
MKDLINGGDPIKVERSAIVINRGWVPEHLKEKVSRP